MSEYHGVLQNRVSSPLTEKTRVFKRTDKIQRPGAGLKCRRYSSAASGFLQELGILNFLGIGFPRGPAYSLFLFVSGRDKFESGCLEAPPPSHLALNEGHCFKRDQWAH